MFGSASVCSPDSVAGKTYIVYIVWGKGGWYSEEKGEKSGNILIPYNLSKNTRQEYFKALEAAAPVQSRIPIHNQ